MDDAPHRTIYRELLNPETIKGHSVPSAKKLHHEAQVLFSAGSHTDGTALMTCVYHLLRNPEIKQRLVDEIRSAWPVLDKAPSYEELEKLPFLASYLSLYQSQGHFVDLAGADCGHQRDAANRPNCSCGPSTRCAPIWRRDRGHQDTWRCSCFSIRCSPLG